MHFLEHKTDWHGFGFISSREAVLEVSGNLCQSSEGNHFESRILSSQCQSVERVIYNEFHLGV